MFEQHEKIIEHIYSTYLLRHIALALKVYSICVASTHGEPVPEFSQIQYFQDDGDVVWVYLAFAFLWSEWLAISTNSQFQGPR